MFDSLTDRLRAVFESLSRRGKLRPEDVDEALRSIRLALLEADVNYQVVKELLARVRDRAASEQSARALNPAQNVVRILHAELVATLGAPGRLMLTGPTPRVVLLVGLQGSGKTTTTAKLGRLLRSRGERVWLVAADPYRPAAAEQLRLLGERLQLDVHSVAGRSAVEMAQAGVEAAGKAGANVVLVDSAGRSQIDAEMMSELVSLRQQVSPVEVLLIADAMTGQEAVNIARGFHDQVGLTGLILTKMDGDARGGAAISMRAVTGVPIKFIGTGEGLEDLEAFEPERLASRILGMGDVLSLIEKAQTSLDQDAAERQATRLLRGEFTLQDFAEQLVQVKRMGPVSKILEMLPGNLANMAASVDGVAAERQLAHTQAILQSMTAQERRRPDILNASRKRRIASGSGTTVQDINQLLRQHQQMKNLYKRVGKRGPGALPPGLR
jgi:signal recognition particle subunit SRP54